MLQGWHSDTVSKQFYASSTPRFTSAAETSVAVYPATLHNKIRCHVCHPSNTTSSHQLAFHFSSLPNSSSTVSLFPHFTQSLVLLKMHINIPDKESSGIISERFRIVCCGLPGVGSGALMALDPHNNTFRFQSISLYSCS